MTLGESVSRLKFSQKEKKRIAEQMRIKSRNQEIFLAYADKTPAVKKLKICGMSGGRPAFKEKVLTKTNDWLTKGTKENKVVCWDVYHAAVVAYLDKKQKNLQKLLRKVPCDLPKPSSDDLLRLICENAKRYKVTSQVIEELYGLWGFKRVKDIGEFLALCSEDEPTRKEEEAGIFYRLSPDELRFPNGLPDHFSGTTKDSQKALKNFLGYNTGSIKSLTKESFIKKMIPNIKNLIKDDTLKALYTLYATTASRREIYQFKLLELTLRNPKRENLMGVSFEFSSFNAYKIDTTKDTFHKRSLQDLINKDPRINFLLDELKAPKQTSPELQEYLTKTELLVKDHFLLWKYIKKDLKTWSSKNPENKQTIVNVIFSLGSIMDSTAPIHLSIRLVPELGSHFKELLKAEKKAAGVASIEEEEQAPAKAKEKTSLSTKDKQKGKKQPSAEILLENFKKELIELSAKEELNWLTKNLVNKISKAWNHEILLRGNDPQTLIGDIKKSQLCASDQLKEYIQHQERKIKTKEVIEKIESNRSSESKSRKKEREELRVLKGQLAEFENAIDEIEDNFSEYASPVVDHPTNVPEIKTTENQEIKVVEPKKKQPENKETQTIKALSKDTVEPSGEPKLYSAKSPSSRKSVPPATVSASAATIAQQFLDKTISDSYRDKESQLSLFWLLVEKGHSNYAYWFVKSLEDSGLRHTDTPPPSLVKAFALADKITNAHGREADKYYEAIQSLKGEEIKNLMKTGPDSGLGMHCLMIASMIQPCFYIHTFPPLFLKIASSNSPDWLRDFTNKITTFCKKPIGLSFNLSTKSRDSLTNPATLTKIQKEIKRIKKAPQEKGKGHQYWKPPAQILLNQDPFKSVITAIEKDEIGKAKEIAQVLNRFGSDTKLRELLKETQKEIYRNHKSSHHPTKKIVGTPVKEFINFFNDLFDNAKKWTEICFYKKTHFQDPEKKQLAEFITSLRTQIPAVRKKIKLIPKGNYISTHAGVNSLEKHLESLEKLINDEKLPLENDFERWFEFPRNLERIQNQGENLFLALRIAKIAKSNFDIREELDESIKNGEFIRSIQILDELSRSEFSKSVELYRSEIKKSLNKFKKKFTGKIDQLNVELRDAYMQTIVSEFDNSRISLDLEIAQEQINSEEYPDFMGIDENLNKVFTELRKLQSTRAKELENEYHEIVGEDQKDNIPPKEWTEDVQAALETKNIYVAEELINSFRESADSSEAFLYTRIREEGSSLQEFIQNEKDIYSFFVNKKPGREIINNIKNSNQYGPLIFSKAIADTSKALTGWNGLNGHQRGTGISKSEKDHLLKIFESLGFSDVNIGHGQALNRNLLIKTRINIANGISPFPHFGSLSHGKYNTVLSWEKSLTEIFSSLDSINCDYHSEPLILFVFADLKPNERIDYWRYCHENSYSILLIDRIIFLFLLSLEDSATVSRLDHTFGTLLPFTFNNPYVEVGPPPPTEMIFGRKEQIRSVLDPRGAAMLFGGRQLGKSTILKKARETFNNPEAGKYGIEVGTLDENLKDFKGTLRNQKVSDEFWNNMGKAFATAGLLSNSQSYTRQTIRDLLVNNENLQTLITLDEVDTFLDLDFQNDFRICSYLRDLTQASNHRFKIVMAGLADVQRYARIPNFPLSQLGKGLPIGMMRITDAMALIRKPLEKAGYSVETGAAYQVLAYTNRHPGLIQVFCHNLVKTLSKKIACEDIKSLGYKVNELDIRDVYKDKTVRSYVISRFRMTLDLDPAWATLTYGLCIYGMEKDEFSTAEAKAIGELFWAQGFLTKSLAIVDTILNEMVSLGILIKLGNMYRLRSHNVKQLLGSQEEMRDELQEILKGFGEKVPEYRHRSYKFNAHKYFSPLTLADEMVLLGYRDEDSSDGNKEVTRNYSVTSIFGSEALGFADLSSALSTLEEIEGTRKTYTKFFIKERATYSDYAEEVRNKLRACRNKPAVLTIEMPKSPTFPEIHTQILNFLSGLRQLNRPENTRVICLFGPEATWKWLGMRNYINHEKENITLSLNRWGRNNIKNVLTTLGFNANNANVDFISSVTGGWFSLISDFLKINAGGVDEPRKIKGINRVLPQKPKLKYCQTQLGNQGLFKLAFPAPILRKLIAYNFENEVSSDNIDLISEEIMEENPKLEPSLFSNPSRIFNWLLRMGMIDPSESDEETDSYQIESLTQTFLKELAKHPLKN